MTAAKKLSDKNLLTSILVLYKAKNNNQIEQSMRREKLSVLVGDLVMVG